MHRYLLIGAYIENSRCTSNNYTFLRLVEEAIMHEIVLSRCISYTRVTKPTILNLLHNVLFTILLQTSKRRIHFLNEIIVLYVCMCFKFWVCISSTIKYLLCARISTCFKLQVCISSST